MLTYLLTLLHPKRVHVIGHARVKIVMAYFAYKFSSAFTYGNLADDFKIVLLRKIHKSGQTKNTALRCEGKGREPVSIMIAN